MPRLTLIVAAVCISAFAVLLYVTGYVNLYWDEWDFVSIARRWSFNVFLLPHNEHWATIPIFIWKLLFATVVIRSHIPYEAAPVAAHCCTAFLLFMLVRRRSGDLPDFAAAVTFLLLGSGATNIVWALQIGFVGSVAFGLLAMVLLESQLRYHGLLSSFRRHYSHRLCCKLRRRIFKTILRLTIWNDHVATHGARQLRGA